MSIAPLILIVDDDACSRMTLTHLLKQEGYRVVAADQGEEGLRLALELRPDVLLTDVVMPEMDGYQLCRRVRGHDELSDLPVIMLTSLEDPQSRVLGIEAGADDFLSKPLDATLLKVRVRSITRFNRFRRIQAQRSRLTWIVENASEGYVLCNQNGEVTFANVKACQLLNLPVDPRCLELYPHLQREFTLLPSQEWKAWPYLDHNSKLELLRPETSSLPACWLEVKVLTHNLGSIYEVLLRVANVTQEKNTHQSVWTFESLISHKLRTPLTKISWGVSFIQRKADRLSLEQIVDFADQAQGGVEELKSLLEEVLSYINAPTAVPGGQGLPLEMITEIIRETAALVGLSPVKLESESDLPDAIYLSKSAFELICFELFQNSKKFHPENDPQVTINIQTQGNSVNFEFIDNGTGLPPDQLTRATKPYYQAERGFSGQVPGMGLGLTMVCTMVQKVGGEAYLRNLPDRSGLAVELKVPVSARE